MTGYRLDDKIIGVQFLVGAGNFSLCHHVQTGSGAHPASYPTRVKGRGHEANHSPSSSAKVNVWSYTSTPLIHLHGVVLRKAQGQLVFH